MPAQEWFASRVDSKMLECGDRKDLCWLRFSVGLGCEMVLFQPSGCYCRLNMLVVCAAAWQQLCMRVSDRPVMHAHLVWMHWQ